MKTQKIVYITIGAGVIILGGWLLFSNNFWRVGVEKAEVVQQEAVKKATLVIYDGQTPEKSFNVEFSAEASAFDLLKNQAEQSGINLETKSYDTGIMIETIGDKKNGQDGKYWLYYINGQMPQVSADKQKINSGDKIEFKFEKSSF